MTTEREIMRGTGPIAILKLLERGEMYGYELVATLAKRTDGLLAMGQSTLYPMLYGLEAKGLVKSRWDDRGTRGRKYYALTAAGRRRLAEDSARWGDAVKALRALGVTGRVGIASPQLELAR